MISFLLKNNHQYVFSGWVHFVIIGLWYKDNSIKYTIYIATIEIEKR